MAVGTGSLESAKGVLMIYETIVTTVNPDQQLNIAPMGMVVDDEFHRKSLLQQPFQLRPFEPSQTLDNLRRTSQGTLHWIDDVLLIARCALNLPLPVVRWSACSEIDGQFLADSCTAAEFEVRSLQSSQQRWYLNCEIVGIHNIRPFPGYNRAQFAVLELTILATRLDWLPASVVRQKQQELESLIVKTGGQREQEAWELVSDWIAERLNGVQS